MSTEQHPPQNPLYNSLLAVSSETVLQPDRNHLPLCLFTHIRWMLEDMDLQGPATLKLRRSTLFHIAQEFIVKYKIRTTSFYELSGTVGIQVGEWCLSCAMQVSNIDFIAEMMADIKTGPRRVCIMDDEGSLDQSRCAAWHLDPDRLRILRNLMEIKLGSVLRRTALEI